MECVCSKCGYHWPSKRPDPKQCPRCKRYNWRQEVDAAVSPVAPQIPRIDNNINKVG